MFEARGGDMAERADPTITNDLMKCAISMNAFNTERDLNIKLSHLQQINKEYNSLSNRLESEDISISDLELAAPVAKEGLSEEVQRRGDLRLDEAGKEQLVQSSKGKVDQLLNFLRQGRTMDINITLDFKRPEAEEPGQ